MTVGADGSPAALAAADWGAHEARLRDVPLRLVHAAALLTRTARRSGGCPSLVRSGPAKDHRPVAAPLP
ncbi:universal stress protein [Streptomyces lydicus]|uniref:universal stress protein n=1 Tax=Streptomyces lydicus TaxID=47763 RepID=UPI00378D5E4B